MAINSPQIPLLGSFDALGPSGPVVGSMPLNPTLGTSDTLEPPSEGPDPFHIETEPPPVPAPCSFNECLSGHKWPAVLALTPCPGCTGSILAVQKTNCPICNEPVTRTILRSDFLPRGAGVAARCKGRPPAGDSLDIEMSRTSWRDAEATTNTFLQQEDKERATKI